MSIQFCWADSAEFREADRFVNQHFGTDSVQALPGRLGWLGFDNPTDTHIWLAHHREKLVALCVHIPATVSVAGNIVGAAFGVDMMVDPEFRRKGIGQKALHHRCEKYGLSLSTGQSEAMSGVYKRRNNCCRLARWHRALFVRKLNTSSSLKGTFREFVASLLRQVHTSCSGQRKPLDLDSACLLLEVLPPRFSPGEAGIRVSSEYFRWRYGGPVYRDYSFFSLKTDSGYSGLLVVRQDEETEYLVDLFCSPDARRDCFRLSGETTPGSRLIALNTGTSLAEAQRDCGFLVRPTDGEVVAVTDDPTMLMKLKNADWCSFAGESDVDLIRSPQL